jgi:hypothetical protein
MVIFKTSRMNTDFHIGFSYQEDIPKQFMSDLIDTISVDGLFLKSESHKPNIFATMEWAIPTMIIAYIAKPYFESFLKEAGKDHYQLLKKGFIQLFKNIFVKTDLPLEKAITENDGWYRFCLNCK